MRNPLRNAFLILLAALLLAAAFPVPAQAQGIVYGSDVPAGTLVDQDLVLIGQNVTIDGDVIGNVFILGNQVTVNGTIDGSLILLAQNAVIRGQVTGTTYTVALTLEMPEQASLGRDLYAFVVSLTSGVQSSIQRDLYAVSLDAGLNGRVGRNVHTAIGPIQLYNGLMRLLGFPDLTIQLHFDFNRPPAAPGATPTSLVPPRPHLRLAASDPAPGFDWAAWALDRARDWLVMSLFGLLAFWLMRPRLEAAGEPLRLRPWRTLAVGLLVLLISVNLFLLAILLVAAVFSLGLALNFLGLWQLSILLWVAAYALLALALATLWFLIVYGSKILVVSVLTAWSARRIELENVWLRGLALVIGLLLYILLAAVPYVGWIISLLASAAGLGSIWLAWRAACQPVMAAVEVKPEAKPAARPKKAK
jgi:cytoskeletal protein CcmA (bactofilin family)